MSYQLLTIKHDVVTYIFDYETYTYIYIYLYLQSIY